MTASGGQASLFEGFFHDCPIAAAIAGVDGNVERVNAAWVLAFGSGEPAHLAAAVDPEDRAKLWEAITTLAAPGARASCVARCRGGDGAAARWFRWSLTLASEGAALFVTAADVTEEQLRIQELRREVAQLRSMIAAGATAGVTAGADVGGAPLAGAGSTPDLAERAQLDRQLRHSQQMVRVMLENIPIVLWAVNPQGTFTYADGLGLSHIGVTPAQIVGHSALERYRGDPEALEFIERAQRGESCHRRKPFRDQVWQLWYVPLRDGAGRPNGVLGLSLDLTVQARAEEELRRQLEIVERQRDTIRALSTPILQVGEDVIALPVLGVVDSARAADLMDRLLHAVVSRRARYAILDLTGVELVDTATADHLLQVARAVTLLGARAILSGIRPEVASVIVTLGVDLSAVQTVRNLREGIRLCMRDRAATG